MKTFFYKRVMRFLLCLPLLATFSCSDFLDVVPDNISTIDDAFASKTEAEHFLAGLFSYLPSHGSETANPALLGADEIWCPDRTSAFDISIWYQIAKGNQTDTEPYANYFASNLRNKDKQDIEDVHGGNFMFTGLRDCNIMLENINKPFDLYATQRNRWIAEIKFLKAYFHFWLMRMYGPIPIIGDKNLELSDDLYTEREPIDSVVSYICRLLDEACVEGGLPKDNTEMMLSVEAGRPNVVIAKALKAEVLLYAASPLFNGNTYPATQHPGYAALFPAYSHNKWIIARDALKEAIQLAETAGHKLYNFRNSSTIGDYVNKLNDTTINAMQVRGAVTDDHTALRWNYETVWGDPRGCVKINQACVPLMGASNASSMGSGTIYHNYCPTLDIVEQFYTDKGLPIDEDPDWDAIKSPDVNGLYKQKGIKTNSLMIRGQEKTTDTATAVLHFNREPRFYGAITFARQRHYGVYPTWCLADSDYFWNAQVVDWHINFNFRNAERFPVTGYICKKLTGYLDAYLDVTQPNPKTNTQGAVNGISSVILAYGSDGYPFPIIRMADLYLMYAEALNEAASESETGTPPAEAYDYIDSVRFRTGLKGVKESWAISHHPDKPNTKAGLREIIQHERMNEFAFEGIRYWDIRRWKVATDPNSRFYQNKPARGLTVPEEMIPNVHTPVNFYTPRVLQNITFTEKNYFQPIRFGTVIKNKNLLQSPGWPQP